MVLAPNVATPKPATWPTILADMARKGMLSESATT